MEREVRTKERWVVRGDGDASNSHTVSSGTVEIPAIYPVNAGSVGFLANANWVLQDESGERLEGSLSKAERVNLAPLKVHATSVDGTETVLYAFNEVSLLRQSMQSAHLRICVNNTTRLSNLVADGVLLATSAGSSAYNYSAGGPVLPLKAQLLALTPLSPFRPRRWKGAVLPQSSQVTMHVLDHSKRPVLAAADFVELRDVTHLHVAEDPSMSVPLMFDPKKTLEDRIFREMFE